jgi:small subunit ribosomal protein S8
MTDPITDMLNRIRNAQAVFHKTVSVPFSNIKYEIVKVLDAEKLIEKVEKKGRGIKRSIEITLKYDGKDPVIFDLKRVSKPGQRIYMGSKDIKSIHGIFIISTPKGLMTGQEARKKRLGGEVICKVW